MLTAQPTVDVTITITTSSPDGYSAGLTVSPTSLIFTSTTWNTPQTVTVTALDDSFAQGAHSATIAHTSASADANFNALTIAGITATVSDNDTAGVTLSTTTVAVTEAGASSNYTIVLGSRPTSTVTITPTTTVTGIVSFSPASVVFSSSTWNTPQSITVSAVDNFIAEGSRTATITHSASSTGSANYEGIAIGSVVTTVTDNDIVGVTVTESGGTTVLTEAGVTDTYTLVLSSQPTSTVTLTISNTDSQVSLSTSSIYFTSTTWNQAQTITVTAVNDSVAQGTHTGTITHSASSPGSNYHGISINNVVATITDNDTAGITLSTTTLAATEGSVTSSFTLVLLSQPTSTVTITLATSSSAISLSSSSLVFDNTNWNTAQAVVVTAVNDSIAEGTRIVTITPSVASGNSNYNNFSLSSLTATVTDNDTAGVTLSTTTLAITEGSVTSSYTLVLTSQPTSTVTLTLTSVAGMVSLSTSSIVFTSSTWNTPVTVTVTAVSDAIANGTSTVGITHASASSNTNYQSLSISTVTVTITDTDTAGVTVSTTTLALTEGGVTKSYTIVLTSEPTSTVTVAIGNAGGYVSLSTSSIAFTNVNWNTPVTVIVTATDDSIAAGSNSATITHTVTSLNTNYNGLSVASVTATITDNDTAGVTLSTTTVAVAEGSTTSSYTIVLTSEPTSTVTIALANTSGDVTLSTSSIAFTTANWNTPVTVTVTATNDSIANGSRVVSITHTATSGNTNYNGISINAVSASITDNDTAGITLSTTTLAVTEGSTTSSYTLVLTSQPTSTVTITLATSTTDISLSSSTLAFTASNWNTPQTIVVTPVNDGTVEGTEIGTITQAVTSLNTNYQNFSLSNITVTITDNDAYGVSLSKTVVTTTEVGTTDSYTIVLTSQPSSTVTITLTTSSPDITFSSTTLTFTNNTWNTPQTIVVTAVNDSIAEGTHTSLVTHSAASSDSNYQNISIANVTATITDNDTAGVTLSTTTMAVSENGTTSTYTIVLTSQPTSTVTIALTAASGDVSLSTSSIAFTSINWNTPQTIVVSPVDDAVAEGTELPVITHAATSLNTNYHNISIASVTVTVTDNDTAGVTLSTTTLAVTEGGATSSYTIVLTSQPTSSVVISPVSVSSDISLSTSSINFTALNWNTPVAVTVTTVNDLYAESTETAVITHAAVSSNTNYHNISIASVTTTITDNDAIGAIVTESSNATAVTEGGTTDSYTIYLSAAPSSTVQISLSANSSDIALSTSSLTFTSSTWSTEQTVTVTAVNDSVAENTESVIISHTSSSTDPNFNLLSISPVTVTVTDNDTASITLTESTNSTTVTEGSTTDSYTLVLTSQPTSTVTITVTPDSSVTVDPSTLTFTNLTWDTPQTVTVTAVNNTTVDGTRTGTITHSASSLNSNYHNISISSVTVTITDNDTTPSNTNNSGSSAPSAGSTESPSAGSSFGTTGGQSNGSAGTDQASIALNALLNDILGIGDNPGALLGFKVAMLQTPDGKPANPRTAKNTGILSLNNNTNATDIEEIVGTLLRTSAQKVTLRFNAGANVKNMAISRTPDFAGVSQEPYTDTMEWLLCDGSGTKQKFQSEASFLAALNAAKQKKALKQSFLTPSLPSSASSLSSFPSLSAFLLSSLIDTAHAATGCQDGIYHVYVKFFTPSGIASPVTEQAIFLDADESSQDISFLLEDPIITPSCSIAKKQTYPNWDIKDNQCLPSCKFLGGTFCSAGTTCPTGLISRGDTYNCHTCCAPIGQPSENTTITTIIPPPIDPKIKPPVTCDLKKNQTYPNWDLKNNQCLPSCTTRGGSYCATGNTCPTGQKSLGSTYNCDICCGAVGTDPTVLPPLTIDVLPPPIICKIALKQIAPDFDVKAGQCLPSCKSLGGAYCGAESACPGNLIDLGDTYTCNVCCGNPPGTPGTPNNGSQKPLVTCDLKKGQTYPDWDTKNNQCLPSCQTISGSYCGPENTCPTGLESFGDTYNCNVCCGTPRTAESIDPSKNDDLTPEISFLTKITKSLKAGVNTVVDVCLAAIETVSDLLNESIDSISQQVQEFLLVFQRDKGNSDPSRSPLQAAPQSQDRLNSGENTNFNSTLNLNAGIGNGQTTSSTTRTMIGQGTATGTLLEQPEQLTRQEKNTPDNTEKNQNTNSSPLTNSTNSSSNRLPPALPLLILLLIPLCAVVWRWVGWR